MWLNIRVGCEVQTAVALLKSGARDVLEFNDLSHLADAAALALSETRRGSLEKSALSTLLESEALYRALIDRIPAVVYLEPLKQAEKSLYISPQIVRIGYTIEEYCLR